MMGEIEGTYRVLQTPGSRLGDQKNAGISTLEMGQNLSMHISSVPAKNQTRDVKLRVKLLDDTTEMLDLETKCYGHVLLTEVYKRLNLIETDYFGVEFQSNQLQWTWLDTMKSIDKQMRKIKNPLLRLAVKFFPPDPGQLQEEYTRYLFALQIKRDIAEERLTCADNTAALLISHLLQSEIGDYDETLDREHLKVNHYVPQQERVLDKILEFHRQHLGQTPAESDFQVLEIARKLEMYGIRFHQASDREGTKINLSVSHMGILVFQGNTKINTFNWSKIRKLSFKRRRFLIKLHPEVHDQYQDILEFFLGTRDQCKNFWKISVEYHTFFRLLDQPKPKAKSVFFSRGSSFRYSGRTQKQLVDYVRDSGMRKAPYERRHSKARVSTRTLSTDVPKQSISFTEGLRVPGSSSSAVSFQSVHTSSMTTASPSVLTDSSSSFLDPRVPVARSQIGNSNVTASTAAAEEARKKQTEQSGSINRQSFQGVGSCSVTGNYSPNSHGVESSHGIELGTERGLRERVVCKNDNDEDVVLNENKGQAQGRASAPIFTLTNSQLQLMEEFIDDDPAEISFFAGGSEAFSYKYGDIDITGSSISRHLQDLPTLSNHHILQQSLQPLLSGTSRYYPKLTGVNVDDDFRYEDRNDFNRNAQASDTSELFEVKAQASRMQCLLSSSETSTLINNRSESSSLNLPLNGVGALNLSASANHSGASSMVNFPACSVRSESSSAFQFNDIVDQLEQLSYPPTMTEDSSSTDSDSWDSETGMPLDVNLFFSNPFMQVSRDNFTFDFQNNLRNFSHEDQNEKLPMDL